MTFKDLASKRYSCRKISDRPVDEAIIQHLLEVQRLAPTACNNQPQRIYVLEGEEVAKKIAQTTPYDFGASLFLVVCYDKEASWKRRADGFDGGIMDAVIAACHLDFAIAEAGLGTCWIGEFDPAKLSQVLELPDHHVPVVIFPLGYPTEEAKPSRGHYSREDLEHTVIRHS